MLLLSLHHTERITRKILGRIRPRKRDSIRLLSRRRNERRRTRKRGSEQVRDCHQQEKGANPSGGCGRRVASWGRAPAPASAQAAAATPRPSLLCSWRSSPWLEVCLKPILLALFSKLRPIWQICDSFGPESLGPNQNDPAQTKLPTFSL
jgi:hypothetical protein